MDLSEGTQLVLFSPKIYLSGDETGMETSYYILPSPRFMIAFLNVFVFLVLGLRHCVVP